MGRETSPLFEVIMKFEIKIKRKHPTGKMRLGKHVITHAFQVFDLDKDEQEELKSKGCTHWFETKKVVKKAKEEK